MEASLSIHVLWFFSPLDWLSTHELFSTDVKGPGTFNIVAALFDVFQELLLRAKLFSCNSNILSSHCFQSSSSLLPGKSSYLFLLNKLVWSNYNEWNGLVMWMGRNIGFKTSNKNTDFIYYTWELIIYINILQCHPWDKAQLNSIKSTLRSFNVIDLFCFGLMNWVNFTHVLTNT